MEAMHDFLKTWKGNLAIPDGMTVAEPEPHTRQAGPLPILLRCFLILCSGDPAAKVPRSRCLDRILERLPEYRHRHPEISNLILQRSSAPTPFPQSTNVALATVNQLYSDEFTFFMFCCNLFAFENGLRVFTNWSKVWEYPWLWYNALEHQDWRGKRLVDLGSEISPMPWFLAAAGAAVTLIETDPQWIPVWENLRQAMKVEVDWRIVTDERIPLPDKSVDAVTSFSVIEHQPDKRTAVQEVARVLKPGGLFALSFDICEPEKGMTFPEWNGAALTTRDFEELIWNHSRFDSGGSAPRWNFEESAEFIHWHLRAAPHHNYIVGAAHLKKKAGF